MERYAVPAPLALAENIPPPLSREKSIPVWQCQTHTSMPIIPLIGQHYLHTLEGYYCRKAHQDTNCNSLAVDAGTDDIPVHPWL